MKKETESTKREKWNKEGMKLNDEQRDSRPTFVVGPSTREEPRLIGEEKVVNCFSNDINPIPLVFNLHKV